jgi:hypothetical protein
LSQSPQAATNTMGDDLKTTLETLASSMQSLQTAVKANAAAIQALATDRQSSSSNGSRSGTDEHHNDRPPQFQKMDFPRYDGKSDPLIFINRCESYFNQQRIMEEEKVWMASYNLEDGAQLWYMQVQTDEGTPSWRRFTELLNLRYEPPLRAAPLSELADCRRTSTVVEYQDHFQALLARAGPLNEEQRVQLFTGGLRPPLSFDVRVLNPQSLAAAMSLARQLELREQYTAAPPRPADRGLLPVPVPAPRLALPAPPAPKADTSTVTMEGRPVKRLTQAEQEERRRLGLCYNCDEKFGRGHNRVCKRLFLLNCAVEEDIDEVTAGAELAQTEESSAFSLHAIAGVWATDTMQIDINLAATPSSRSWTPGLLTISSPSPWRSAPGCPSNTGPASQLRWRTTIGCRAWVSYVKRRSLSRVRFSSSICLLCLLQVMTWFWAPSGWRRWARSSGISTDEA